MEQFEMTLYPRVEDWVAVKEGNTWFYSYADALHCYISGNKQTATDCYWYWRGTAEKLGVPPGAAITSISLSYDWRCYAFNYGKLGKNSVGPCTLVAPVEHTFSPKQPTVSGVTDWATVAGAPKMWLDIRDNLELELRIGVNLRTEVHGVQTIVGFNITNLAAAVTYIV